MNNLALRTYQAVSTTPPPSQVTVPNPPNREEACDANRILLMTVNEAARCLSIGRPKMWQLVMTGDVLSIKIGASRRIPVMALEAYVQRLSEAAEQELQRREHYGQSR
jgi:excisionase family DNA binding protein